MASVALTDGLKELPALPEFSEREWKDLNSGKFIKRHERFTDGTGFGGGKGVAYMVLDRPPQKVWDQILDFNRYTEFFPSVAKCHIYKQDGGEIFAEFVLKVGLIIKIHYFIHHTFNPDASRMTWKVDDTKKNDFRQSIGMWTAWPLEQNRSLVGYTVSLESGRAVPKIVEDLAAQSGLTKVMEALRNRVHTDGRYRR